jgi:hypothetical protein
MEDVLEVYKRSYDPEYPVICMDEINKQLVKEVRNPIQAKPGKAECYDSEYERNGTGNVFIFFEPLKGYRYTETTERRTSQDWAKCIKELVDNHYPLAKTIVLVMDNLNTHVGASLYKTFEPQEAKRILDKLEIHYTPKHGSWLNIAESELSHLSRQCLDRRIPDIEILKEEVEAWTQNRNQTGDTANWQFTTEDARIKLRRLYPEIK